MTAGPRILEAAASAVALWRPIVFDLVAYFEPSAHFQYSRRVRNEFEELAEVYSRNTWLLGRYGGRPNMQTDIAGIGIASRVEIGRLVLREASQHEMLRSALQMFRECQDRELASGVVSRIVTHFPKADERPRERAAIRRAFVEVFPEEGECTFLGAEEDTLELGHSVVYQSLTHYLREDGIYHSAHRSRIDKVQRHLHQEVGRYESHRFFLRPEQPVGGAVPAIAFCYTGEAPDARVEAFMEGYTGEKLLFVPPEEYRLQRDSFTGLEDYERASRRFGGKWILQGDVVRLLMSQHVSVLYLFADDTLHPEVDRTFSWEELYARQRSSRFIARASRNSQTYLEMVLEGLVRNGFVEPSGDRFALAPGFADFRHVTFYQLGEFHKRQRL